MDRVSHGRGYAAAYGRQVGEALGDRRQRGRGSRAEIRPYFAAIQPRPVLPSAVVVSRPAGLKGDSGP